MGPDEWETHIITHVGFLMKMFNFSLISWKLQSEKFCRTNRLGHLERVSVMKNGEALMY